VESANPTLYPEVNAAIHELLAGARDVLGEQFVGLYLAGSLAAGDFDPHSSDIDFAIVTAGDISDESVAALAQLHARLAASGMGWVLHLEGAYFSRADMRRHDPARARHPTLSVGGGFAVEQHGSNGIVERYTLREQGVVVSGPPIQDMIDPVTPDDLRGAVLGILHEWWEPMLGDVYRLQEREYQAYAILTMCRMLYTLEFGRVVSKPAAARWAQQTLGQPWSGLIERAWLWQTQPVSTVDEVRDFIRLALARGRPYESSLTENMREASS
jgi:hypothetical protein